MAYSNRPPFTNIPFKFTETGYTAPDFTNVRFSFGLPNTADLRASLQAFGIYTHTTYTYLKSCPTITISYPGSIQILHLPCIYGGIRDVSGYIYANPFNADLSAHVYVSANFLDLNAYVRSTIQAYYNIGATIRSIPPFNLYASLHGFATSGITALLAGFDTSDILSIIAMHLPVNLSAYLNVIEIRDLSSYISGEWWHGSLSLSGNIYKIYQRGIKYLRGKLHSYDTFDLLGLIASVYKYDLPAIIQSTTLANLSAAIEIIGPVNLYGSAHGFAIKSLLSFINGKYGPGHLRAAVFAVEPEYLEASIHGYKGIKVPFNLRAIISSFYEYLLPAKIAGVEGKNLAAILIPRGSSIELYAKIIPKVVHLKKVLLISLLEHKDLNAIINYSCFASSFSNLFGYLYTIYKKDLKASVFPLRASNEYLDLSASVNAESYYVEDKTTYSFLPEVLKYTVDRVVIRPKRSYYNVNTIDILYGNYYMKNLYAVVQGILRSSDLSASIRPVLQPNYSELPEYIKPKTHEVVIKLDSRGREQWRRFVELMFRKDGAEPYHYFYVSGENKVYKVDRSRHWTIWAYSYIHDDNSMIERRAVRSKFIFNINNYNSIDEAVRDLIDRVSAYRECDLTASIYPFIDKLSSLKASIASRGRPKHRWASYLAASINQSDFNFVDKGYTPPSEYDFNFKK